MGFYVYVIISLVVFTVFIFVITERRKADKLIHKLNLELENKVAERTAELKKSEEKTAEYAKSLKIMVDERTKELEEKVVDLEKLNKFMVGRELKMIELKNEIYERQRKLEELREKLPVVKAKEVTKVKK